MQAVSAETGVPGDTLRSWQRRYGFPSPSRNESNYRLFSQRDIEGVTWVRDQTARGQGTREAIAMLQRSMDDNSESPAPPAPSPPPVIPPLLEPVRSLAGALLDGDLEAAQVAWDRLSISLSADALCGDVILPAHGRIWEPGIGLSTRIRADAFLLRKAVGLFDRSAPERGLRDIVVLTHGDAMSQVPAYALGTVLSRGGYRLPLPLMDAGLAETMVAIQQVANDASIVLVTARQQEDIALSATRRTVRTWWYTDDGPTGADALPCSIGDVVGVLERGD